MNTLLNPGQTAYRDFGPLHLRIDRHHEGVSIAVTNHPTLDRIFTRFYLYLTYTGASWC